MFDELSNSNLMSSSLLTTPSLLLQLDSQMAYSAKNEDEKLINRRSNESGASSKNTKLVKSYIDIIRQTFDIDSY